MYVNRNTKIMLAACVFLYLLAGVFRLVDNEFVLGPLRLASISYLAYCVLCMLCIIYLRRDIPNTQSRRYLVMTVVILFAWQIVGMLRDVLFPDELVINRWLWYSYYIAMLFIPTTLLIASLNSGLDNSQRINPIGYVTLGVSAVLSILVMLNDYHQWAFAFPQGIERYYEGHVYNVLFFICMSWIFIVFGMICFTLWNRIRVEKTRTYIWIVFVSIGLGGLYLLWRITNYKVIPWLNDMYDVPQIWEAIVLVAIELSVRLGVIRANYNFLEFFTASTISASLVNRDGTIRYQTSGIVPSTRDQRLESLEHNVYLDRDHRLSGRYIPGGYAFWTDDLSQFNELSQRLSESQDQLKEENNLIKAENEIIARRAQAGERNKLYDLMAKSVSPELDIIENLIKSTAPDSPDFRDKLSEACIYKAYIKRYCNMMLLAQDNTEISTFELESSIRESMQYISLQGTSCDLQKFGEGFFYAEALLLAYEIFERTIVNLKNLESLTVELSANERRFRMNIQAEGRNIYLDERGFVGYDDKLAAFGGRKKITSEQDLKTVRVDIPKAVPEGAPQAAGNNGASKASGNDGTPQVTEKAGDVA